MKEMPKNEELLVHLRIYLGSNAHVLWGAFSP